MLRDTMCSGEKSAGVAGVRVVHFGWMWLAVAVRLVYTSIHSTFPSLYKDIDYLSRMFCAVQQQLRYYIVALQDVLPYGTAALTAVAYVVPAHDDNKEINFSHLYEVLIHFV